MLGCFPLFGYSACISGDALGGNYEDRMLFP